MHFFSYYDYKCLPIYIFCFISPSQFIFSFCVCVCVCKLCSPLVFLIFPSLWWKQLFCKLINTVSAHDWVLKRTWIFKLIFQSSILRLWKPITSLGISKLWFALTPMCSFSFFFPSLTSRGLACHILEGDDLSYFLAKSEKYKPNQQRLLFFSILIWANSMNLGDLVKESLNEKVRLYKTSAQSVNIRG